MDLTLESGKVISMVTEYDIRTLLAGQQFAILTERELTYLQCARRNDEADDYVLEYQAGSLDEHYVATDTDITLERVISAFLRYRRGDASWWNEFHWQKMEL